MSSSIFSANSAAYSSDPSAGAADAAKADSFSRDARISDIVAAQTRLFAEISARENATNREDYRIVRQGYRIGELRILAKFDATSELATMPPIHRLPGAPDGVKGLANLHGNIVPVFEIAKWFNVKHDPHATPMLLVLGYGDAATGVVIDGLPVRKNFLASDEVSVEIGHPRMARFAQKAYRDDDGIWMEFDDRRFFETFARRFAAK